MDRREALKKLSAGGAIAVGGSFVLSSTNVAYAASTGTAPTGTWRLVSVNGPRAVMRLRLGSTSWILQSASGNVVQPTTPPGQIQAFNQNPPRFTVVARKAGGWSSGDVVTAQVSTVWDCGSQTYTNTFTI